MRIVLLIKRNISKNMVCKHMVSRNASVQNSNDKSQSLVIKQRI